MDRIYGIDTGDLSPEAIERSKVSSEIELFYSINILGGHLWRTRHDSADGRINMSLELMNAIQESQYSIEYLAYQSNRFGTCIPLPSIGKHIERTELYSKWFKWWNAYTNSLTDEQIVEINECLKSGVGIEKFRPEGDWKDG